MVADPWSLIPPQLSIGGELSANPGYVALQTQWDRCVALAAQVQRDPLDDFRRWWVDHWGTLYEFPDHLLPYVRQLIQPSDNIVVSAPPQHGKTETTLRALAWRMLRFPHLRNIYATYNATRAGQVKRLFVRICEQCQLPIAPVEDTIRHRTDRGQLLFTSVDGSATGEPVDGLFVVDDAYKNAQEARSASRNQVIQAWHESVLTTRVHPQAHVVVMATRWADRDYSGWLIDEKRFRKCNLEAICETEDDPLGRPIGAPLWPSQRPLAWLLDRRDGTDTVGGMSAYFWSSMYQGSPQPLGSEVFGDPVYYQELPTTPYRSGYGMDLAYTASTSADYSVIIKGRMIAGQLYVTDLDRWQLTPPQSVSRIAQFAAHEPGPIRWYLSGTEKGVAGLLPSLSDSLKGRVQAHPASADKFVRSTPLQAAWQKGLVLLPVKAKWTRDLVRELADFRGVGAEQDDQVDALAALWDLLAVPMIGKVSVSRG